MARLGELTYDIPEGPIKRTNAVLTKDVEMLQVGETEEAWLTLRDAKTCAPGSTQTIKLRSIPNELCPVAAVRRQLEEAGKTTTSLFGYYDRCPRRRRHLTRTDVITLLQKAWSKGGFAGISGHSFRMGGASLQHAFKVPLEELKEVGQWTSNSYQLYIQEYTQEEKTTARRLLRGADIGSA